MVRNIQSVSLELVKLDQENVRFGGDIAESQKEALQLLMDNPDDAKKLYKLAQDISQHGMDPTELQLAFPDGEDGYIVIEGNRRLAALKLLVKPDLCPVESMVKKFVQLKASALYTVSNDLELAVVATRKEGDRWIELKHTGENEGVGRVSWSSDVRDERKARVTGIDSIGKQVRNLVSEQVSVFSDEAKAQSRKIAITNLTRFFQSSSAQEYFQLKIKSKILTNVIPIEFIAPSVSYALSMMAAEGFTVKDIFHVEDRDEFIGKIPIELAPASLLRKGEPVDIKGGSVMSGLQEQPEETDEEAGKPESSSGSGASAGAPPTTEPGASGKPRPLSSRKIRSRLIDWPMKIEPSKINELFRELRYKLNVQETPYAIAVALRVFIEVSCEYYIRQQHDAGDPVTTDNQNKEPLLDSNRIKLAMKIQGVAAHLHKKGKLNRNEASTIKRRASEQNQMGSVEHLNLFVHGYSAAAIPSELNAIADEYKPLLVGIWS